MYGEGGDKVTEFNAIYKTYFHDVYLYIKKLSGSDSIAEDITSETFFKAMRAIDNFRNDCDVRVWLCQIAKNCYFTYLKKRKRLADIGDIESLELWDSDGYVEDKFIAYDEAMRVHAILQNLKELYKEVFALRVFGELSFTQIGQIFGKTENWACVAYHRTRNKIKEKMEDADHE